MALRSLDNATWGFGSNCFVCEPSNSAGLRIPFFHDEEAALVRAEFCLDAAFSGAPSYVHGGITLAVLDEAMAWAAIALAQRFALTRTTTTTFLRPVLVGRTYLVEAGLAESAADSIGTRAVVLDAGRERCAEAAASFVAMSGTRARHAMGSQVDGADSAYLGS